VKWDLGFGRLLSATSYGNFHIRETTDFTGEFGALATLVLGTPAGLGDNVTPRQHAITQELRLSSPDEGSLRWQLGGFFTNQDAADVETFYPIDAATRESQLDNPVFGGVVLPVRYREFAGFANLDYYFTPQLDWAIGGRYSHNNQAFHEVGTGVFGGGADFGRVSSQGVLTYSTDLRWHFTPQNMVFARVASGFVPGGPNAVDPGVAAAPQTYTSSTATDYEIGLKNSLLDRRMSVEVTAFHVLWQKIQLQAVIGGLNQFVNGGSARSDGLEGNLAYTPIAGLSLNLNGAYTHAYLTDDTPASVNGHAGDRLPAVPLFGGSAGAEYEHPLAMGLSTFGGADWRYTGSRFSNFVTGGPRQEMPSFSIFDLRAGIRASHWSATLYAKNVGNKLAISYVQPETLAAGTGPQSAVVYTPRTFGATLTASF
jgi:outer membrane receptor protein involved in Fe transport